MLNFQWIHCSMDILRTEKRNYKKTYWYILFHCSKLVRLFELIHSTYQTIRSNQINCKGLQTTICYRFPNPGKDKTRTATSFLELKRLNFFHSSKCFTFWNWFCTISFTAKNKVKIFNLQTAVLIFTLLSTKMELLPEISFRNESESNRKRQFAKYLNCLVIWLRCFSQLIFVALRKFFPIYLSTFLIKLKVPLMCKLHFIEWKIIFR